MPPFVQAAACVGLEDFGFEVSENGQISFDTTIVTDENEWKEDVDEWMHFFRHEWDFFDVRGRKRNIPTAYLIKSSRKKASKKSFEAASHHSEGLGKRSRTSQIPAAQKEFSGFPFFSWKKKTDSCDSSAGSSSRYGKVGPIDSEELITVKGLSRNNMQRTFPANQPVLVMNSFNRSSKNVMSTGLLKQKKSAFVAAVTISSDSSRSSSSQKKSVFRRLGRR